MRDCRFFFQKKVKTVGFLVGEKVYTYSKILELGFKKFIEPTLCPKFRTFPFPFVLWWAW